jgi:hypothetical protein
MNEDYLWDRSGGPEPDVVHLEQLLSKLRWPKNAPNADSRHAKPVPGQYRKRWSAIAAAVAVMLGFGAAFFERRMHTSYGQTSWQLSIAEEKPREVRAGQLIETSGVAHGTMKSAFIGQVKIEPNSRLRVLAANAHEQRLSLDHGTIHALIWAPPARFVVDTPSGKTIDLGCQYTLSVEKEGKGFLTVEVGWVAFQWRNIESFIPAGAACTTRPGHGPDTPHFLDAPEALTKAVAEFDVTGNTSVLDTALSAARPRDALTLWHLLQRTQGAGRAKVLDRFGTLVNLPSGLTRESILNGDRKSMDAAWNALRLGDTSWWREWKREW